MGTDSTRAIYLRFAGLSFVVVVLVTSVAALLAAIPIRSSQEHAATSAAIAGAAPLSDLFRDLAPGAPVSDSIFREADGVARMQLTGTLRALRVWGPDGAPVYSAGVSAGSESVSPPSGVTSARITGADGSRLFATFVPVGAYTVEVDQDAGSVDASISSSLRIVIAVAVACSLAAYGLLQATFWLSVRAFAEGHSRLQYLYTRGDEIRSSLDLHEVVTHLSRDATRLARGEYGMVALFQEDTGDLILHATYEHHTGSIAHHQRPIEEWFLRRCVATNTTVVSSQPASAYRQIFGPDIELVGQVALLCVPVSVRARVVGALTVIRTAAPRRGGFSPAEVQQVEELAGQAVMAIEQAQLFAKVRSYADEIELSYDATLKALMAALDAKDEVTEGHCERVARLTLQLARQMGVPDSQLVDIERGALLHDVGKIGVPDAVLKKPKALNDGEWEAMRRHPLLAGLMVSKIGFLEGSMPILLYHHERYDGTGYPFGLTAEKIPLEARIFSIVDAYDAMTSDRPYRDAMTHEAAMAEVAANSGLQFDPEVVAAFQHMMDTRPELRHVAPHQMPAEHDDHDEMPSEDAA